MITVEGPHIKDPTGKILPSPQMSYDEPEDVRVKVIPDRFNPLYPVVNDLINGHKIVGISESLNQFLSGLNTLLTDKKESMLNDKALTEDDLNVKEQIEQIVDSSLGSSQSLAMILDEELYELNYKQHHQQANLSLTNNGSFTEERLNLEVNAFFAQLEGKRASDIFLHAKVLELWKQHIESSNNLFHNESTLAALNHHIALYKQVFMQMKTMQSLGITKFNHTTIQTTVPNGKSVLETLAKNRRIAYSA